MSRNSRIIVQCRGWTTHEHRMIACTPVTALIGVATTGGIEMMIVREGSSATHGVMHLVAG